MAEIGTQEFLNFGEALNNANNSVFNQQSNIGALKSSVQTIPIQNIPIQNIPTQIKQMQPLAFQHPPSARISPNVARPQVAVQHPQQIIQNNIPQNIVSPDLPDVVDISSYFSIFGFQISRTTIYILIGFVVLLIGYFIYSKFFSKTEEKKKKKKSQVSFKSQEENDDQDENEDVEE